jgi:hypothetical protein
MAYLWWPASEAIEVLATAGSRRKPLNRVRYTNH